MKRSQQRSRPDWSKKLTYSPPSGALSNSPATTISATWPRLSGNLDCSQTGPMMTLVRFYVHQNCLTDGPDPRSPLRFLRNLLGLQVILVCKSLGNLIGPYQDLFMRLVGRASIAPLALEGHPWACRSLLSVWVPSHSDEWVLCSPELAVGRASIAPLT